MAVFGLHILFAVYDQQATIETADEVLIAPHVAEGLGMIGPSLRDQGPAEGTNIDGCSDYGWAPDYLLETLLVAFPRRLRRLCPGGMAATPRRLDHNHGQGKLRSLKIPGKASQTNSASALSNFCAGSPVEKP
eukprot:CAMPEP_0180419640 /NCGR_PEP_ID=MMETSP1036_2-20121128/2209_1 /TAXON_ID=632150 /ORGANISM="Azadinium spinosum, Strain 3D9" /LENGTH=132 /DNA_ID=CAMNT_0022424819 /DNA_START=143 /DNA_END=541 /DNA_ORIENTATION=+